MSIVQTLFDDFTGANATLASHTSDSGDTWTATNTNVQIDGSGSLYNHGDSSTLTATSSQTVVGDSYIEIGVVHVPSSGFFTLGIGSRNPSVGGISYLGGFFFNGNTQVKQWSGSDSVAGGTTLDTIAGSPTAPFTIRIENGVLSFGGNTYAFPALPAGDNFAIWMQGGASGNTSLIDYVDAGQIVTATYPADSLEAITFGQPNLLFQPDALEAVAFGEPSLVLPAVTPGRFRPVVFGKPIGPNNRLRRARSFSAVRFNTPTAFHNKS